MKYSKGIALIILLSTGLAFGQGSLTPPGTPAPTMKTLDELNTSITQISNAVMNTDTRIDIATVMYTTAGTNVIDHYITQPGEYYLSSNLNATNWCCIYIIAEGVTLDLNGFSISSPQSKYVGIVISSVASKCTIKNGSIQGFEFGVSCSSSSCSFKNLILSECSTKGLISGTAAQIINCRALNNEGIGIYVGKNSHIENCIAEENEDYGILLLEGGTILNCIAINNAKGISVYGKPAIVKHCISVENDGTGLSCGANTIIEGCIVRNNASTGISIGNACVLNTTISSENTGIGIYSVGSGSRLTKCLTKNNISNGIFLQSDSSVSDSLVAENRGETALFINYNASVSGIIIAENDSVIASSYGLKISSGNVKECVAWSNSNTNTTTSSHLGMGIRVGDSSSVKDCAVCENQGTGIYIEDDAQVIGNQCHYNGVYGGFGYGIYQSSGSSRIEDNLLTGNDVGLYVHGSTNLIIRNTASGNGTEFDITGTQICGAIVTNKATISTKDSFSNFEF